MSTKNAAAVVLGAGLSTPSPVTPSTPDGTNHLGSLDDLMANSGIGAKATKGKAKTPVVTITEAEQETMLEYIRADARMKSAEGDVNTLKPGVGKMLYGHFAKFCRSAGSFVKSVSSSGQMTFTCS